MAGTQFASASDPIENYKSPISNEHWIIDDTQDAVKFPKQIILKYNGTNSRKFSFEYDGLCRVSKIKNESWDASIGDWVPLSAGSGAYTWDEYGKVTMYGGTECTRDAYGRVIKTSSGLSTNDSNGKPYIYEYNVNEYTYDETGRLIAEVNYTVPVDNMSEMQFRSKDEITYDINDNGYTKTTLSYQWSYATNSWSAYPSKEVEILYKDSGKKITETRYEDYDESGEILFGNISYLEYAILSHDVTFTTKQFSKKYYRAVKDYLVTSERNVEIVVTGENDFKATDVKATDVKATDVKTTDVKTTISYNKNTGAITRQNFSKTENEYRLGCPVEGLWTSVLVKSDSYGKNSADDEWTLESTMTSELDDRLSVLKSNRVSYYGSEPSESETIYTRDELGRTILTESFEIVGNTEKVPSSKTETQYYLDTDYACTTTSYQYNDGWQEYSSNRLEYDPEVQMTKFQNYLLRDRSGLSFPVNLTPVKFTSTNNDNINETIFEYYDRADIAGVEDIEAEDDAQAEYFDLQGRSIDFLNLKSGVYVRRCGTKVDKIIIK